MPAPTPNEGESHDEFMSRCTQAMSGEMDQDEQAASVCQAAWDDANTAPPSEE